MFFLFEQKTAYEVRISDWISGVCSSDLNGTMNNDFLTDWGLSLMVFLPLAGALVMILIPKAEEGMHKVVALLASLASAGVGIAVMADSSEERRVGKECVSTCRSRCSSDH